MGQPEKDRVPPYIMFVALQMQICRNLTTKIANQLLAKNTIFLHHLLMSLLTHCPLDEHSSESVCRGDRCLSKAASVPHSAGQGLSRVTMESLRLPAPPLPCCHWGGNFAGLPVFPAVPPHGTGHGCGRER